MREYAGACHCGALSVRYRTALPANAWSVRACQCSFCRKHAGVTTSDPAGELAFAAIDESQLQRYRFGTGLTEFWICRRCGVYLGATMEGVGVLNVRCLKAIPADLPEPVPMQYGDESKESKHARRIAGWTPLAREELGATR